MCSVCVLVIVCELEVARFNWNAFVKCIENTFQLHLSNCSCNDNNQIYLLAGLLHHVGSTKTAHLAKCIIAIDYWEINDLGICQQKRTIRCKKKIEKFVLKKIYSSFVKKKQVYLAESIRWNLNPLSNEFIVWFVPNSIYAMNCKTTR